MGDPLLVNYHLMNVPAECISGRSSLYDEKGRGTLNS